LTDLLNKLEAYGLPTIRVGALRIWVHGYEFPESTDAWDGNWLRVTAHCAESGASVVVSGAVLDTVSFLNFYRELAAVYESLEGTATLQSLEPELRAEVRAVSPKGAMEVRVEITPDHLNQDHRFLFAVDQSYLPEVLRACKQLLAQYPVRGPAGRGA
jgi:hypothetical protein